MLEDFVEVRYCKVANGDDEQYAGEFYYVQLFIAEYEFSGHPISSEIVG